MKRLILAAGMAVIIHALFLSVEAEWVKTRMARKKIPEPITLSLHYQETRTLPRIAGKTPLVATSPPIPKIMPKTKPPESRVQKAVKKPLPQKRRNIPKKKVEKILKTEPLRPRVETPAPITPGPDLPEDWMQIPQERPLPVQDTAPETASITPVKEEAAVIPKTLEAPAPDPPLPPLVEATPVYRKNPAPRYPRNARRRGYEGKVILEVLVNEEGSVEDLRIFESSGYRMLDRAAMKSVQSWLFEPGRRGDERVEMWVKVPIRFDLK